MSIFDFFTREAGQERRRALDDFITQFIPPEIRPQLGLLAEANPVVSMERAGQDAQALFAPDQGIMDRLAAGGRMASNMAGVVAPAAVAGRAGVPVANAVMEGLLGGSPAQQAAADMARGFVVDESGALRLYHGSPHDFDRFSMDKIGTGEGAQAYGQGLYFAENEGVARGYRDALARPYYVTDDGVNVAEKYGADVVDAFESVGGDPEEITATINRLQSAVQRNLADFGVRDVSELQPEYAGDLASSTIDMARRAEGLSALLKSADVRRVNEGRMYEVQINANPEDFIDYDAPLSAQSPTVQRQFGYVPRPTPQEEVAAYELAKRESPNDIGNHPAVQDIYRRESGANAAERNFQRQITGGGVDEAARITLSEAGIPGIRYLDAGSRGAGDGSRNYVIFDENLISIVRKYGIAGAAAMLGVSALDVERAMAQGQQQPQGLLSTGAQ